MGNQQQKMKIHTVIYDWMGSKDINLKGEQDKFEQSDVLITETGNLLINP